MLCPPKSTCELNGTFPSAIDEEKEEMVVRVGRKTLAKTLARAVYVGVELAFGGAQRALAALVHHCLAAA